jgi:hypothetical protein
MSIYGCDKESLKSVSRAPSAWVARRVVILSLAFGLAVSAVEVVCARPTLLFAEPAAPPSWGGPPFALVPETSRSGWIRACSFRHPLCVHGAPGTSPALELETVAALDRAWDALALGIGLPAPDLDLDGVWHTYLVDEVEGGAAALPPSFDPRARFDRAVSFALIDRTTGRGCALELAAARAVARGAMARMAPRTDVGSAFAETEAIARLATPCEAQDADSAEFQAHPERAVVDGSTRAYARGAGLFFEWLDARFAVRPGTLIGGLWALAPSRPQPVGQGDAGAPSDPTGFDVLRVSLRDALWPGSTFDDAIARFAVDRYFVPGPTPRVAWRLPWPAQARRLAAADPPAPTGASYLLVERVPGGQAKLRVEAQWEDYARMRWLVVKLDTAGKPLAELRLTAPDRATRSSLTVESLDGVDSILVVAVHLGSTEHAFDPRQGEWEPHGWLVTLSAE